jgi:xanthine dehydrogenase accessory factor
MDCPIGLPGITGKEPAVIAASVSAQLLMVWEAAALAQTPAFASTEAHAGAGAPSIRLVGSRRP